MPVAYRRAAEAHEPCGNRSVRGVSVPFQLGILADKLPLSHPPGASALTESFLKFVCTISIRHRREVVPGRALSAPLIQATCDLRRQPLGML